MTNRQLERLLDRMVIEVPAHMTAMGYRRDTCILHTRVAVDALRAFGVRARPLAAQVMIGNRVWADDCRRLNRLPQSKAEWGDGSWCLGIGFGPDPRKTRPGYDGHVIAIVNDRYGLDLTLDQASRPERGIRLGAHYWKLPPGFVTGDDQDVLFDDDGSIVIYKPMPEDRGFLTAPDWLMAPQAGTLNPVPGVIETLKAAA